MKTDHNMIDPGIKTSFKQALQIRFEAMRRRMHSPIIWLLFFTFLHGLWYAAIVHPWQAPDEYVHYEYLRGFLQQRTFDPFKDGRDGAVQHELIESLLAFQHYRYRLVATPDEQSLSANPTPLGAMKVYPHPPLYYLLSAPIYALSQNASPLTQLYLLRAFSVVLQCLTVWLTYKLASMIFKTDDRPWLTLFPAALIALLPQYTFISASYNNDSLVPPLVAAALFFLMRGYRRRANPGQFGLSLLFGFLALSAKRTAIGIVPVLGLGLLGYAWKWMRAQKRWVRWAGVGIWAGSAIALLVLLVFLRQPPTLPAGLARLMRMNPDTLVRLNQTFSLDTLQGVDWRRFFSFMLESFWGWFGWLTLKVSQTLRGIFPLLTALLTLGLLVGIGRQLRENEPDRMTQAPFSVALLFTGVLFTLVSMIVQYALSPEYYPPQGRYLFPFLPALAILGVWAWLSFWPRRVQPAAQFAAWLALALYDMYVWAFVLLPEWYS